MHHPSHPPAPAATSRELDHSLARNTKTNTCRPRTHPQAHVTPNPVPLPPPLRPAAPLLQAAAPLATVSSHADPWPHYIMSGACFGSAFHSYSNLNNPRAAGIKLAFGVAYLWAG